MIVFCLVSLDDDQEGVMDNLIEALQSGSAFSRPHKKRGQARAAGGKTFFSYIVVGKYYLNEVCLFLYLICNK